MTLLRNTIITLVVFFIASINVFSREIIITVVDEELDMPLEGAVVTLRNGQQFFCTEDGTARITLPDDRQTVVQVMFV